VSALEVCAAVVAAFWLAVALDLKRRWPGNRLLSRGGEAPSDRGSVLVVVPARNEGGVIGSAAASLGSQAASFAHLVIVDDRSADGTGAEAREGIREAGTKAEVIQGEAPPEGWTGKLHALQLGLDHGLARLGPGSAPEWILFTDGDILHRPGSIDGLLAQAAESSADLVSIMARLRARSFWEKLCVPPFLWFFQFLYPFRRISDPRSSVAAAAGGCLLVRRSLLDRLGGLEAIRGELIDDVAIGKKAKQAGGRLWLGLDPGIESLRGYDTFPEIVELVARTAYIQLRRNPALLAGTLVFLGGLFVAPPVLAVVGLALGSLPAALCGLVSWGVQSYLYSSTVRYSRVNAAVSLTLPLASLLYAYMTFLSAWRHWVGRGLQWKGRAYARRGDAEEPVAMTGTMEKE
jgi:hopene-associated glycosyltransferase HpnB